MIQLEAGPRVCLVHERWSSREPVRSTGQRLVYYYAMSSLFLSAFAFWCSPCCLYVFARLFIFWKVWGWSFPSNCLCFSKTTFWSDCACFHNPWSLYVIARLFSHTSEGVRVVISKQLSAFFQDHFFKWLGLLLYIRELDLCRHGNKWVSMTWNLLKCVKFY